MENRTSRSGQWRSLSGQWCYEARTFYTIDSWPSWPLRGWHPKHPLFKHLSMCFPFDQRLPFLLIFQITDACQRINYLDRCSADSSISCAVHCRGPGILPAYPANHPRSISKSTRLARHVEKDVAPRRSLTVTTSYLHTVYGRLARKKPAGGRRIRASALVLMAVASYSLLDK